MMPDEETYSKGTFSLTEWEDVNYCDHYFRVNDKGLTDKEVVDLLYKLNKENEKLKQSVNNLKDTIIKITIAYQRKYDRTIVKLVHEVHDEDITDLIKELQL